jgi:23S rRNA pseudouridine2605 synthase
MPEERLQKILARAGVASRRKAETLMLEGRVTVNGQTIVELGAKADFARDHIKVDGKLLHPPKRMVYLAFHKPKGVVTTASDPQGRPTVMEYFKGVKERVFPVGRLDYAAEGLLLVTNDGELANAITSAASHVAKTYLVKVNGLLSAEQEKRFREGIPLHGRRTAPAGLRLVRRAENPWYEVRLTQGRHHQILEMFKHFGRLVEKIKRVKVGFLELGSLEPGRHRPLTPAEVDRFRRILKLDRAENAKHPRSAAQRQDHRGGRTVQQPKAPEL